MRQKWPFTLWLFFIGICMWMGQASVHTSYDFSHAKVTKPFFYKLEKDGVTSYLLGTQHLGLALDQFPAEVVEALDQANIFVAEDLDNDKIEPDLSRVAKFEQAFLFPWTKEKLKKRGLNLEKISPRDSILKVCMQYTFWDAKPAWHRLDKQLEQLAIQNSKKLLALDEADDLTLALQKTSEACELNQLTQQLPPEQARENYINSIKSYVEGSEATLVASAAMDDMMLLGERNIKWLPKIIHVHAKKAFVAVGALHLFGERGLIPMLQKEGFIVTRIEPSKLGPALAVAE